MHLPHSKDQPHSFAFSGSGWLLSYHLGVISGLRKQKLLESGSIFSGSSGGAIAAALCCLDDLCERQVQKNLLESLKNEEFQSNIDVGLRKLLKTTLPHNSYEKCNNKLHITMTKIRPSFQKKAVIVNKFDSTDHMIECIAASCFIPLWSSKKLTVNVDNEDFVDGGVFAFTPHIGNVSVTPMYKVYKFIHHRRGEPTISPNLIKTFPYSEAQLIRWGLFPPDSSVLEELFHFGYQSSIIWGDSLVKR